MKIFARIQKVAIAGLLGVSFIAGGAVHAQSRQDRREDRREDRQDRREDRQDRREDRRDNRQDRRDDRRGRNWDRYGAYGGSYQLRQTALNAGYNEGIKEARKNRSQFGNFRNTSSYRNASKDYNSRLGNRALYQRYFREGYQNGYEDGYRGY